MRAWRGPQSDRALLIAGPVAGSGAARPSLAPLAEALRAGGRPPAVDQVDAPTSAAALTRAVEATARAPGVAWVVCVGAVQVGTDGLALDIGGDAWPLALFGDAGAARSVAIAIIDAHPDVTSEAVLAALGDRGLRIAIVTADGGAAALDALVAGLRGAALDLHRGAVTATSLAAHVARTIVDARVALPAGDDADRDLFEPPSLERLWRLGWSVAAGPPYPQARAVTIRSSARSCPVASGSTRVSRRAASASSTERAS
jgi:hypothetical protein